MPGSFVDADMNDLSRVGDPAKARRAEGGDSVSAMRDVINKIVDGSRMYLGASRSGRRASPSGSGSRRIGSVAWQVGGRLRDWN
jgi:hypothetical protein